MTTTLRTTIISFVFLTFSPQLLAEEKKFMGVGFGVGVALTVDAFGGKVRVESASVVNDIVRVDEERNAQARVVLDLHYFFKQTNEFWNVDAADWGHGPFLAIQPGDNEIVNAIGFGWMIGFRRSGNDDTDKERQSWNFGIGYLVDPNARVLGDGLEKDQPLPAGESEVRYKTEGESSLMLIFSFRFL